MSATISSRPPVPPAHSTATPTALLCIVGPTAAGKTELAAALAREFGAEVIGADSRQVYRHMEIGTAKPSPELRREIRHHLIDVADPDESYDASRWQEQALAARSEIEERGKPAIVCGGTGLYIRCLTRGLFTGPPADPALRTRLEDEEVLRPGVLHERLEAMDPATARRIHPHDRVRIVRALEVQQLTGKPISAWHTEHGLAERRFELLTLAVAVERGELHRRIARRAAEMVAQGLVEELAELRARGYPRDLKAFSAIGYKEAGLCLDGAIERACLAEEIARSTRRYAKRQQVWIRGQTDAVAVAAGALDAAFALAEPFLNAVAKRKSIG